MFVDIATFIQDLDTGKSHSTSVGQTSKKRKLEGSQDDELGNIVLNSDAKKWDKGTYSTIKDLSFQIPLRKKLTLEVGLDQNQGLRLRDPLSGSVELDLLWEGVGEFQNGYVLSAETKNAVLQSISSVCQCLRKLKRNTAFAFFLSKEMDSSLPPTVAR